MAPAPANGAEALREILEYEKIVQFKDAVLAGTHPRIKIPAHLAGKQPINSLRNISSPNSTTPRPSLNPNPEPPARTTPGSRAEASSSFYDISPNKARAAGGAHIPSRSEINPILLEKSDDLIKAEMQLQRQRLEKGLRDQIEQQRMASRSLMQTSESLPNFDISEVLSKALAIVHPSTTTTTEAEPADPSGDATDDSFDNNTFYTSEHGTPGPPSPAQGENISAELQSHSALSLEQRELPVQVEDREVVMTGTSLSNDNITATQARPQMHSQNSTPNRHEQLLETGNSGPSSSSGEIVSSNAQGAVKATTHDLLKQALDKVATSPLIRNHNLSPIAPQPARVSPLATARDPPILRQNAPVEEIQPFQVSALRNQQNGNSSTDNSSKDVKERKREKRKEKRKRKGKEAATTPESPYIKPEPRSPSPFTAVAPLPRPQKRQRQSGQFAPELNYDEPRHEHVGGDVEHRAAEEPFREARAPRTYERIPERYESEIRRPEPVYRRIEEDDFRPVAHSQYGRRPPASEYVALPHVYSESRPTASYAPVERRTVEPAFKEIDLTQPVIGGNELSERIYRASVRPGADRDRSRSPMYRERRSPMPMAPPRHPMRIIVDEFGRKYYEPVPALRQSIAPPTSYREASVIYERPPIRAVSSRVPAEYEREGVIYRASSPPLQRRVVTEPEYAIPAQPDYREYRQREYSIRPTLMGPPGPEYVQVRGRPITPVEDMRREYVQRAPSAYPEVRYEIPREYARVQSVRPEAPPREYAASVRPEARREMAPPQAQREYSVRPADAIPVPRRQILAEGERYYEQDLLRRPAEVAYIERPRAREGSVVVYADDVRREIYR
ncbi:uncharacterized protein L3040_002132 [Drepanopeziza brunnea f. sp. 'multigermtubi']|uniref:uncharacterized protein n=1 Tax=Drepanopeziza brunnea f. sp. 'multigermtubi' TaxID=698441 RepID=UPI002391ACAA|nr:hypothetical protein L3040_002132 [Drepanopeziza brunnea f. sp. 'multigermtubi']